MPRSPGTYGPDWTWPSRTSSASRTCGTSFRRIRFECDPVGVARESASSSQRTPMSATLGPSPAPRLPYGGPSMQWWSWLRLGRRRGRGGGRPAVAVQARRRRGGVIVDPAVAAGPPRPPSRHESADAHVRAGQATRWSRWAARTSRRSRTWCSPPGGGAVGGAPSPEEGCSRGPRPRPAMGVVAALGPDAVMIEDESALQTQESVLDASAAAGGSGGDVIRVAGPDGLRDRPGPRSST